MNASIARMLAWMVSAMIIMNGPRPIVAFHTVKNATDIDAIVIESNERKCHEGKV